MFDETWGVSVCAEPMTDDHDDEDSAQVCVIWPIYLYTCDMTQAYAYVWYDPFICVCVI